MIPFCRRVDEAKQVIALMAELGLERGKDGLEVYVMCEIPNNVLLIDEFAKEFDGFSIGSNDLTQLTLGVDRDSEIVAFDFDERDEGVKTILRMAIEGARRNRPPLRYLRSGAFRLSRNGGVSRAPRDRLDQPESGYGVAHDDAAASNWSAGWRGNGRDPAASSWSPPARSCACVGR